MIEEWKPIEGFSGYYISNHGRVKGSSGKILSSGTTSKGYQLVVLHHSNGVAKGELVHHLVLRAFKGKRPEGYQAHHKDNNKYNNSATNLEWISIKEHLSNHGKGWVAFEQIQEIRQRYADGNISQRKLAQEYGISQVTIGRIIRYETRKEQ